MIKDLQQNVVKPFQANENYLSVKLHKITLKARKFKGDNE